MKVCPECSSVYGDDFVYCSNDGAILVEENPGLPPEAGDAEAETVIRRRGEPITVDLNEPAAQVETAKTNHVSPPPVIIEKSSSSKYYALFLLIGLLLGGGLVLATLLAARILDRPGKANVSVQTGTDGGETDRPPEGTANERDSKIDEIAGEIHRKSTTARSEEDFNGRVIVENANVRTAPDGSANRVDILPTGDRLVIERRENSASPWYYVVCEHGISGWMHGNTIEFTNVDF